MRRHLHRSRSPVLAMIVALVRTTPNTRPLQRLVVRQRGEDAKDDRHARVELDAHERVRHAVADVLEVHRRALDEHADGDHRVERLARHVRHRDLTRCGRGGAHGWRRRAKGEPAEQVCRGRTSLDDRA